MGFVITGCGAVTPLGVGVDETWRNLLAGKSGIQRVTGFPTKGFKSEVAGIVDWDLERYLGRFDTHELNKWVSRAGQFSIYAAVEAATQANLPVKEIGEDESIVIIGSGGAGIGDFAEVTRKIDAGKPRSVSAAHIIKALQNMIASETRGYLGLKSGPTLCIQTACATGGDVFWVAESLMRDRSIKFGIIGGAEAAVDENNLAAFGATRALSEGWSDAPETASRPFDRDRNGFVIGEGAAVVILEDEAKAKKRGAKPLARLRSVATGSRKSHKTEPDLPLMTRVLRKALQDAGWEHTDVDAVYAHGTGTPLNDKTESQALLEVLGDHAREIPVTSTKSMIGHILAAAGTINVVCAVKTLETGWIPPTINSNPDPEECPLDYVLEGARQIHAERIMTQSFGFGNQNNETLVEAFKGWEV